MRLTNIALFKHTLTEFSNKTGFGPYRFHRRDVHFVGTEPSVLKYHHVRINFF